MAINYTKRGWTNNSPPAINSANLGAMDDALKSVIDHANTIEAGADVTATALPTAIKGGTATTTPADTDVVPGIDSGNARRFYTWANIKSALGAVFAPLTHASRHQHGGVDEIATATPAANAIPKATSSGKLDAWISDASTSTKGKVQLAVASELVTGTDDTKAPTAKQLKDATALDGFWLAKRTKMPDGTTAVYASNFATIDGWASSGSSVAVSVSGGELLLALNASGTNVAYKDISFASAGHVWLVRVKSTALGASGSLRFQAIIGGVENTLLILSAVNVGQYTVYAILLPVGNVTRIQIYPRFVDAGAVITVNWTWVGNYSYLAGSLSEEAARVVNRLGDTTGVGAKATTTLTSNGTNVSNGDTVTLAGKVYTFKTALTPAEGEVLIGATYTDSLDNLVAAIIGGAGNGTLYSCAAANPLVTASRNGAVVTITALQAGILGNQITTSKSATTLTLENPAGGTSTLAGGYDDVGAKVMAQIKLIADTARTAGEIPKLTTGGNINVNGVAFPATQSASSNPNTLDDYEEGTWTPTLLGSTTPGTPTYTVQYGFYTKVGRKVTLDFVVTISAKNDMAGNLQIGGIPFVSTSATGFRASGAIGYALGVTYSSEKTSIALWLSNGKSVIDVLQSGSASNSSGLPIANIASPATISASITYIV